MGKACAVRDADSYGNSFSQFRSILGRNKPVPVQELSTFLSSNLKIFSSLFLYQILGKNLQIHVFFKDRHLNLTLLTCWRNKKGNTYIVSNGQ